MYMKYIMCIVYLCRFSLSEYFPSNIGEFEIICLYNKCQSNLARTIIKFYCFLVFMDFNISGNSAWAVEKNVALFLFCGFEFIFKQANGFVEQRV